MKVTFVVSVTGRGSVQAPIKVLASRIADELSREPTGTIEPGEYEVTVERLTS